MGFSDYNSNPDLNTSISGVNIGEGCPPSGINNAIRQIMADAKTADGGYVKNTSSGAIVSSGLTVSSGATIKGGLTLDGNGATTSGNYVADNGKTDSTAHRLSYGANANGNAGIWDYTNNKWLILNNAGGATTLGDGPVTIVSGATISGGITISGGVQNPLQVVDGVGYPTWTFSATDDGIQGSACMQTYINGVGNMNVIVVDKENIKTRLYGTATAVAGASSYRVNCTSSAVSLPSGGKWCYQAQNQSGAVVYYGSGNGGAQICAKGAQTGWVYVMAIRTE